MSTGLSALCLQAFTVCKVDVSFRRGVKLTQNLIVVVSQVMWAYLEISIHLVVSKTRVSPGAFLYRQGFYYLRIQILERTKNLRHIKHTFVTFSLSSP